jgi:Transposase, Mutator family
LCRLLWSESLAADWSLQVRLGGVCELVGVTDEAKRSRQRLAIWLLARRADGSWDARSGVAPGGSGPAREPERTPMTTQTRSPRRILPPWPTRRRRSSLDSPDCSLEEQLADALKGLSPEQITGPGGLVSKLAGRVIETALEAEMSEHLGYPPGQAPPGGAGNHRNGSTPKTVKTKLGPVQVKTPRDRAGSFEPQLVGKRQTRLAGLDEKILGLYAGGMSVRDIEAHLRDLTTSRSAVTRSAASPTRCSRTCRSGARGRWTAFTRSRASTA